MSTFGKQLALAICVAAVFGVASWRGAMAISTLSDSLKDLPGIFRNPSSDPPNPAVHRDFSVRPRHSEPEFRDVGPRPEEEPVVVPAAAAPWAVAIAYGPQLSRDFLCAGTLITKDWVLTAAHCTYNLARRWPIDDSVYVFENVGALSSPGTRFPVSEIIPHPEYNPRTLQNDLALVRIVTGGKSANAPIPLAGLPLSQQVGEIGSIVGWGIGSAQAHRKHDEPLHVIQVAVLDDQLCFSASDFPALRRGHVFCGRSLLVHHDICFRYGGSPIVFYDKKANLYLGGMVSWPAACDGSGRTVNVFLDVQSYLPWIRSVVGKGTG